MVADAPQAMRSRSLINSIRTSRPELLFWVGLILLVLVGYFLRAIDLDQLPSGLYRDEAMNALDGFTAISSGRFPLYYPDNYDRGLFQEGFFVNLQGITSYILSPSLVAARLPAVLIGVAGIVSVAFMARQLFSSRTVGLIAATLLTFSYWGINFSRIGFSAILVPTVLAVAVGLLVWASRSGSVSRMFGAGIFFGFGIYTYAAYRFAPLLALLVLVSAWRVFYWPLAQAFRLGISFVIGAGLTAIPMLLAIAREPRILTARAEDVSLVSTSMPASEALEIFLTNLALATGKFFFLGDLNIRHNYGPYAILSPVVALLFAVGIVLCLVWIAQYLRVPMASEPVAMYALGSITLLGGLTVMTIPEVLSVDSAPHSLRSIGSQPFVMTLAAIPIWKFVQWFRSPVRRQLPQVRWITAGLVSVLVLSLALDLFRYYSALRSSTEQRIAFDADLLSMVELAEEDGSRVVFLPYPQQQAIIRYLAGSDAEYLRIAETIDQIERGDTVWLRQSDELLAQDVLTDFPDATLVVVTDDLRGTSFLSIETD